MKKILVISNNCLSRGDNNGRTMDNILHGWETIKVAQFYIQNSYPDSTICENFFRVTDTEALKSIWHGQKGKIITKSIKNYNNGILSIISRKKRNSLTMIFRNAVWDLRRWEGSYFYNWLDSFNPEVVFFQVGDNSFMIKIALRIAKKNNIPLIVFNSEGYFFQDDSYMKDASKISNLFYPIFRDNYRKNFKKMMDYCSNAIYLSDELRSIYLKYFKTPASVIYTPTGINTYPYKKTISVDKLVFSYIGNLGLNRHIPLIEIAKKLHSLNANLKLNVYGNILTEDSRRALLSCDEIDYKGVVNYSEVNEVIRNSDVLFHVESSDENYIEILKFGFSTKIADSLMSGRMFLLYAPPYVACTKYMLGELPSVVATNTEELDVLLKKVLTDSDFRYNSCLKEIEIAKKNHSFSHNDEMFSRIINSL